LNSLLEKRKNGKDFRQLEETDNSEKY
jgi:hypothetical protein